MENPGVWGRAPVNKSMSFSLAGRRERANVLKRVMKRARRIAVERRIVSWTDRSSEVAIVDCGASCDAVFFDGDIDSCQDHDLPTLQLFSVGLSRLR